MNVLGASVSAGDPVQVELTGPDHDVLQQLADQVVTLINDIDGVHNPSSSASEGRPEMQIVVDESVASQYGMTRSQVMGQFHRN